MSYATRQKQANRRAAIAQLKREYRAQYGVTLSDSDARACFRGECSSTEYALAFRIAREYGID